MPPEGYETIEAIAVALGVPYHRVQTAIKALRIVPTIFPDDRRRRYYSPEAVAQIRAWVTRTSLGDAASS